MPTQNEIDMLRAARAAGITTREEMANFMGQMGHESQGFTRLEESFRYRQGIHQIPVESAWREGREALQAGWQAAQEGRPQELARLMYGGRMGNDDAGDGYLYRGRGYTQLTGEGNYREAGRALDLDLVGTPVLAADPGNAQRIAIWYWQDRVPAADRDDVTRATLAVNGGTNGLEDRHNRYDAWHAVLTPEFVTDLDAGRVVAGRGVAPAIGRPAMEDDALRRLEQGAEVRDLIGYLRALNVRDDRNREIPAGDVFTDRVEQGVRRFQQQQDLPITGRADPATLDAIERAVQQQRPHEQAPAPEGQRAPGPAAPQRQGALLDPPPLNDPGNPNHASYAFFLDLTRERGAAMGLTPSAKDEVLAAGLTAVAFDRGIVNGVGFAKFSADGTQVAMSDTKDPSAEWARTGVGKVGELLQQPIEDSSRIVADVNRTLAQQQTLAQSQSRTESQENPTVRGPSMA